MQIKAENTSVDIRSIMEVSRFHQSVFMYSILQADIFLAIIPWATVIINSYEILHFSLKTFI